MLCEIKRIKNKYKFKVEFELTPGELLALEEGMREYALKSPVAADVFMYLCNAQKRVKDND